MMYGTVKDGVFTEAPHRLNLGDFVCFNPSPEIYEENGYLPVEELPYPEPPEGEAGAFYVKCYTVEDGKIVQGWVEGDPPHPTERPRTAEERILALEEKLAENEAKNASLSEELEAAKILLGVSE